jgi:hypothetical protein
MSDVKSSTSGRKEPKTGMSVPSRLTRFDAPKRVLNISNILLLLLVGVFFCQVAGASNARLLQIANHARDQALWPLAPFRSNGTRHGLSRRDSGSLSAAVFPTTPRGTSLELSPFNATEPPPECPPCFNCLLSKFECLQFGSCSPFDGHCVCPPGFGGDDCSAPSELAELRKPHSQAPERMSGDHDGV